MSGSGRGLLNAACLIGVALVAVSGVRLVERERRLIEKFRQRRALDAASALRPDQLSQDERDCATWLAKAGVLTFGDDGCYLHPSEVATFRRKRVRLLLSVGFAVLVPALIAAVLLLHP